MKFVLRCVVTMAILCLSAPAVFGQQADGPAEGRPFAVRRAEHALKITSEQRAQIKAILEVEKPRLQEMRAQAEAERTEMNAGGSFDEARARSVAEKYSQANADRMVETQRVRAKLLAVLTPEQKAKIEAMRTRFGGAVDGRMAVLGDLL